MIRLERMAHPEKGSETRTRQKLDQWHNVGGIDIVRESSCCNVSLRCPLISYIVWAVFLKYLMRVHLINPSHVSFGVAVITPRWLYVLAAATGTEWGDPHLVDETITPARAQRYQSRRRRRHRHSYRQRLRGYEVGRQARERGAWVVYGGIHATLFPEEPREHGGAHAVVKGDGDIVWAEGRARLPRGTARRRCTTPDE